MWKFRLIGYALLYIGAFFLGMATKWYVAPCVILMIIGYNITDRARQL